MVGRPNKSQLYETIEKNNWTNCQLNKSHLTKLWLNFRTFEQFINWPTDLSNFMKKFRDTSNQHFKLSLINSTACNVSSVRLHQQERCPSPMIVCHFRIRAGSDFSHSIGLVFVGGISGLSGAARYYSTSEISHDYGATFKFLPDLPLRIYDNCVVIVGNEGTKCLSSE